MNVTESKTCIINARLRTLLDECPDEGLREAMAYSVAAGGKRLRPLLLLAACEAACGCYTPEELDFACAVEMIHTYSLIHDDLPAMDNDDLRRGMPTCHKAYGEATAILAGDALLSHAFEHMARICVDSKSNKPARAMYIIAQAAGAGGMVAGQMSDMRAEHKIIDESTLLHIHELKTGALITACLEAGAVLGGGTDAYVTSMARVGYLSGRAFQIKDDILNVTATTETLGKPVGSDEKCGKNTYVTVHGLKKAIADCEQLSAEALSCAENLKPKTNALLALLKQIMERTF